MALMCPNLPFACPAISYQIDVVVSVWLEREANGLGENNDKLAN